MSTRGPVHQERAMAVSTAPVTPAAEAAVRHAQLVGLWAVECPCARRGAADWAEELLGRREHLCATMDADGYLLDGFRVERVGALYVRLVCDVTARRGLRTVRGAVEELLLAGPRRRSTRARLID